MLFLAIKKWLRSLWLSIAWISPRELLKTSILSNTSTVFLLHSHPSGDPKPSAIDLRITRRLKEVYDMMEIQLADHIIVGGDSKRER